MIAAEFNQRSVVSHSKYNKTLGKTNIFISQNWNKDLLLANNYYGIKAGDVLYARSTDKRVKFNNLKIGIVYPPNPKNQIGGLHAYTNDLILPEEFYATPLKFVELSNKPFTNRIDTQITYVFPSGKTLTTSPKTPPIWSNVTESQTAKNTAIAPKTVPETTNRQTPTTTEANIIPTRGLPAWLKIALFLSLGYGALKLFKVI